MAMTTVRQLRKAALGLVQAEETTDDQGRATFVVDGRVFAVLDGSRVRLHLPAPDVAAITAAHPAAEPAPDGATLALEGIDGQQLNHWVRRAWAFRAPPELAETSAAAATARPGGVGDLPRAIGRPATRALADAGVTTLAQVAAVPREELLGLHGVGPKAVRVLDEALGRGESS
jgi:predicted flap endonuclease-1-like 5' DNA nuclease